MFSFINLCSAFSRASISIISADLFRDSFPMSSRKNKRKFTCVRAESESNSRGVNSNYHAPFTATELDTYLEMASLDDDASQTLWSVKDYSQEYWNNCKNVKE